MATMNQDLVTDEQRDAVLAVCDAVDTLNRAIDLASSHGIMIGLRDYGDLGSLNRRYMVETHEIRVVVMPAKRKS